MNSFKILLTLTAVSIISGAANAQLRNDDVYKMPEMNKQTSKGVINIPNIGQYKALKCDLHTHTVFSDGLVWPTIRVDEVYNDGLDAIAITDHIQYRPYRDVVIGDLNEPAKIAIEYAKDKDIIVIRGTEITHKKPFGHMNALFISDAEKINVPDPEEAVDQAIAQGAFIMWNHPGWPDNLTTMYPVHEKLIAAKKIHGIEIFNLSEFYPKAIDWARDMGLAILGNSDIHSTITSTYGKGVNSRPFTIVFANERNEESIKEAMFAGRTAVVVNDNIVGRKDILEQLFRASIEFEIIDKKKNTYNLTNKSDLPFVLEFGEDTVVIPGGRKVRATLPVGCKNIKVSNCITGNKQTLEIVM